jgi:tripartite-type tricarboxylate transporter receptor subunit TctC
MRFCAVLLLLSGLVPGPSFAQDYPVKPVRLIVPYVAGGNADLWARTLAQKLSEAFKQPFVVENRAGANGGIGTDFVAKSPADGYTLLATASGPLTVNPVLYAKVPYDPLRDFAPIAQCVVYQYVSCGAHQGRSADVSQADQRREDPGAVKCLVPPGEGIGPARRLCRAQALFARESLARFTNGTWRRSPNPRSSSISAALGDEQLFLVLDTPVRLAQRAAGCWC